MSVLDGDLTYFGDQPMNHYSVEENLEHMIKELNDKHGHDIKREDFKSVVVLDESEIDPIKVKEWMRDSLEGKSVTIWSQNHQYHFFFEREHDAMGFKLMWI